MNSRNNFKNCLNSKTTSSSQHILLKKKRSLQMQAQPASISSSLSTKCSVCSVDTPCFDYFGYPHHFGSVPHPNDVSSLHSSINKRKKKTLNVDDNYNIDSSVMKDKNANYWNPPKMMQIYFDNFSDKINEHLTAMLLLLCIIAITKYIIQ